MGILDGYKNLSQQDFLGEAANANNNGNAQSGNLGSGQRMNDEGEIVDDTVESVATGISWNDENGGDEGDAGETISTELPEENLSFNDDGSTNTKLGEGTVPNDFAIKSTSKKDIEAEIIGKGGDESLAKDMGEVVGPAKGVQSYLANLEKQIDKQKNKRRKARLLAFGLALMGGESMATALSAANQTPFFDDEELNLMLDRRKDLIKGMHATYLESQGVWTPEVQEYKDGLLSTEKKEADIAKVKAEFADKKWNPGALKEAQAKAFSLGNELVTGINELDAIEKNNPKFNPSSVSNEFIKALATDEEGNVTGLKEAVLKTYNPIQAAYIQATMKVVTAKLRGESGAAIGPSEWVTEMKKMTPARPEEFEAKRKYRNRILSGLTAKTGAPDDATLMKALGFPEGANGDEWYAKNLSKFDLDGKAKSVNEVKTTTGTVRLDDIL